MPTSLFDVDRAITTWVASYFASPVWQWALLPFTAVGYGGGLWIGIVLGLWVAAPMLERRAGVPASHVRMALWRAVLAVVLALLLVDHVLKPLVARDRPFVLGPQASAIVWIPTTTSFPSGHAASAAAGALSTARAWPPVAGPVCVVAFLVILSRVALGVHFAGDVIGGAIVGLLVAAFVTARPRRGAAGGPPRAP